MWIITWPWRGYWGLLGFGWALSMEEMMTGRTWDSYETRLGNAGTTSRSHVWYWVRCRQGCESSNIFGTDNHCLSVDSHWSLRVTENGSFFQLWSLKVTPTLACLSDLIPSSLRWDTGSGQSTLDFPAMNKYWPSHNQSLFSLDSGTFMFWKEESQQTSEHTMQDHF